MPLGPAHEGKKNTPAIVIGRGPGYKGHVEIVAYGWLAPANSLGSEGSFLPRQSYCVWIENPPESPDFGSCDSPLTTTRAVQVVSETQGLGKPRFRYTDITGPLTPEVASVRVSFHRRGSGRTRHVKATVAQVSGQLQEKLRQPEPFGYFDARVRGLVPWRFFRVKAFDAAGNVIGSARGF